MSSNDGMKEIVLDPTIDFIAGTVAGIAALIVGHPFDTVKVRFQTPQISHKYRSTFQSLTTIVREERVFGLYKGITFPLASCALLNGLIFSSYGFFTKIQLKDDDRVPTISQVALAGIGCGITCSIVTTPVELVKIRQQAILTPSSTWTVTRQIMRTHGIRGLYRGITATILRDCGYGAYFAAYELSCRFFSTHHWQHPTSPNDANDTPVGPNAEHESGSPSLSWAALLLSGGIAGVAGWIATFPFDVVKTRIQGTEYTPPKSSHSPTPTAFRARGTFPFAQPSNLHSQVSPQASHSPTSTALRARGSFQSVRPSDLHTQVSAQLYRTTYTTVVNSYQADGIGVFYRGLAPTLIRAIPVNMMTFATFQTVVHMFST